MRRHRTRTLLIVTVAALLAAGLAACFGGGNNEDPQKVLHETFASGKNYSSGVLAVTLTAAASSGQGGSFDASVKGPFESVPGGFPKFNLQATVKGSLPFSGGLISTGSAAYVNVQGSDYQIPQSAVNQFKQLYLGFQSQTSKLGGTGNSLTNFFTNLKNQGTEDVNGTNAIHISGKIDVQKLVAAAKSASSGQSTALQGLDRAGSSISGINVDVFSGSSDKHLVKLDADISFNQTSASPSGHVKFSLGFSNLGQPQTITAPTNPKPIGNLLQALQSRLGASGASGGAGGAGGAGAATSPTTTGPGGAAVQSYLSCLQQARGQAAIQACQQQLHH